ncbi:hypothetical protein FSW04_11670 [Baekduia soli]|uniref:Uncharacterized protein n=1 Tax=Baekduia soli TaxID=496014 RepID=A0A5B8U5E4_9ACTN|nr:hypothetical protein [Baekduia soli]QEC48161.1 hypothetical protein FSW04_11670 [Baekduia soli]
MDQEDLPPGVRVASGDTGSDPHEDARPASAEGRGASSLDGHGPGTDAEPVAAAVTERLRALQHRIALLADGVHERAGGPSAADVAGTGLRIVAPAPSRPQLPPHRASQADPGPPPRARRHAGAPRRAGPPDRRVRRRDRRRGPRPGRGASPEHDERRAAAEDRRGGRPDRRLGDDRRALLAPRTLQDRPWARRLLLGAAIAVAAGVPVAGALALAGGP